jgi:hypothetical protein
MLQALEYDGQPLENYWPYATTSPSDWNCWKPPTLIGELFHRKAETTTSGFDSVWTLVCAGRPAIIIMSISLAFFQPSASGEVESNEPIEAHRRHAVIAVGVGRKSGKRYVLVRNSWGASWGIDGHAWIAEEYLSPRISQLIELKGIA